MYLSTFLIIFLRAIKKNQINKASHLGKQAKPPYFFGNNVKKICKYNFKSLLNFLSLFKERESVICICNQLQV